MSRFLGWLVASVVVFALFCTTVVLRPESTNGEAKLIGLLGLGGLVVGWRVWDHWKRR